MPTMASLWVSAIKAMQALDSSANQRAIVRVDQHVALSSASPGALTRVACALASTSGVGGSVGVNAVMIATTDMQPAMYATVIRVILYMPREARCGFSLS